MLQTFLPVCWSCLPLLSLVKGQLSRLAWQTPGSSWRTHLA